MYKLNVTKITGENGIELNMYGIDGEHYSYTCISANKEKVERLCSTCNKLGLSEIHLLYVIEDTINQ